MSPPLQLIGGGNTEIKSNDDNPTVAGSIVDFYCRLFWHPDSVHIYEGCVMRITDREGDIKAAITMIILSKYDKKIHT